MSSGPLLVAVLLGAALTSAASPAELSLTHDATPSSAMTHIAHQELVAGKNVTWLEPVTEAQYGK